MGAIASQRRLLRSIAREGAEIRAIAAMLQLPHRKQLQVLYIDQDYTDMWFGTAVLGLVSTKVNVAKKNEAGF